MREGEGHEILLKKYAINQNQRCIIYTEDEADGTSQGEDDNIW